MTASRSGRCSTPAASPSTSSCRRRGRFRSGRRAARAGGARRLRGRRPESAPRSGPRGAPGDSRRGVRSGRGGAEHRRRRPAGRRGADRRRRPRPGQARLAVARGAAQPPSPRASRSIPVDYAFEVVGDPAVMEQAVGAPRPGGRTRARRRDARATRRCRSIRARSSPASNGSRAASTAPSRPASTCPAARPGRRRDHPARRPDRPARSPLDELEDAFDEPANGGVRTVISFA